MRRARRQALGRRCGGEAVETRSTPQTLPPVRGWGPAGSMLPSTGATGGGAGGRGSRSLLLIGHSATRSWGEMDSIIATPTDGLRPERCPASESCKISLPPADIYQALGSTTSGHVACVSLGETDGFEGVTPRGGNRKRLDIYVIILIHDSEIALGK